MQQKEVENEIESQFKKKQDQETTNGWCVAIPFQNINKSSTLPSDLDD